MMEAPSVLMDDGYGSMHSWVIDVDGGSMYSIVDHWADERAQLQLCGLSGMLWLPTDNPT